MRNSSSAHFKAQARVELFARQHRCSPTESEARLWSELNARQLGVSFHRQVPLVGLFTAGFFAPGMGSSSKWLAPFTPASVARTRAV